MKKINLIAETAWHHDGDYRFMDNLVSDLLEKSAADTIKMHITIDFDEYMHTSHPAYTLLKEKCFTREQWNDLIDSVISAKKELLLLYNDVKAVEFGANFTPNLVEVHSVCLNDINLLDSVKQNLDEGTGVVLGVGGATIQEVESALRRIDHNNCILMFGFQNYPTNYEDINFNKIKRLMQLFPECSFGYADHTAWNEPNNVLITLMGAALGMDYVEKHVTNVYGQERIDWNSAVSIETFNEIAEKLGILSRANSDGSIMLNNAEKNYSTYGKMKKAAILKTSVNSGDVFNLDVIEFKRVGEESDISQIDVVGLIGRKFSQDLPGGSILLIKYFAADE